MMTKRVMAVVAACLGILASFAAPASAHDNTIQRGDAIAWVSNGHTAINVYDQSCFGNYGSWTEFYYTTIGGSIRDSVSTPCGTTRSKSTYPQRITSFRACNPLNGCGPWTAA
jgi:hypothetical protein